MRRMRQDSCKILGEFLAVCAVGAAGGAVDAENLTQRIDCERAQNRRAREQLVTQNGNPKKFLSQLTMSRRPFRDTSQTSRRTLRR